MSNEPKFFGQVRWCVADVQALCEKLGIEITPEKAEEFLKQNEVKMQDRITEYGWEVMETLMRDFEPGLDADDTLLEEEADDPE